MGRIACKQGLLKVMVSYAKECGLDQSTLKMVIDWMKANPGGMMGLLSRPNGHQR